MGWYLSKDHCEKLRIKRSYASLLIGCNSLPSIGCYGSKIGYRIYQNVSHVLLGHKCEWSPLSCLLEILLLLLLFVFVLFLFFSLFYDRCLGLSPTFLLESLPDCLSLFFFSLPTGGQETEIPSGFSLRLPWEVCVGLFFPHSVTCLSLPWRLWMDRRPSF